MHAAAAPLMNGDRMNLIAAVDEKWGIGRDNGLLASIPGDMKFFKNKTTGKVVVMGRKTLESMPKKRGLPNRINYVLTSRKDFEAERCVTVNSEEELFEELKKYDTDDVFIIGGESIYRRFYGMCDRCWITKMQADLGADRFMVDLDEDPSFELKEQSDVMSENGIDYRFCLYEKVK